MTPSKRKAFGAASIRFAIARQAMHACCKYSRAGYVEDEGSRVQHVVQDRLVQCDGRQGSELFQDLSFPCLCVLFSVYALSCP